MKLKDRVAVVTGGASGIGAASAIAFAAQGARVLVVDVDEAGSKKTVEQIEKAGGRAVALRGDVTRAADNQAVVERATALWSRLDIFYANAGVPQWKTEVEDVEEDLFDRIMAVNVKGVFLAAKYALPVMKRQSRGVFLVTASTAAIRPRTDRASPVPTFMNKREIDEEGLARYVATVPLGRLNQPEDIARTAVFLVSDEAGMITGSCIEVDGGRCI